MVVRFDDVFMWRTLKVNASKSKPLVFERDGISQCNII